jgi:hypothetical protein
MAYSRAGTQMQCAFRSATRSLLQITSRHQHRRITRNGVHVVDSCSLSFVFSGIAITHWFSQEAKLPQNRLTREMVCVEGYEVGHRRNLMQLSTVLPMRRFHRRARLRAAPAAACTATWDVQCRQHGWHAQHMQRACGAVAHAAHAADAAPRKARSTRSTRSTHSTCSTYSAHAVHMQLTDVGHVWLQSFWAISREKPGYSGAPQHASWLWPYFPMHRPLTQSLSTGTGSHFCKSAPR